MKSFLSYLYPLPFLWWQLPRPTRHFVPWLFETLTANPPVSVMLFHAFFKLLQPSLGPFFHSNIRINLSRKLADKCFYATSICRSCLLISLWSHHYDLFRASACSGEGISMRTADDEMNIKEGMYPYRCEITVCKLNPFLTLGWLEEKALTWIIHQLATTNLPLIRCVPPMRCAAPGFATVFYWLSSMLNMHSGYPANLDTKWSVQKSGLPIKPY